MVKIEVKSSLDKTKNRLSNLKYKSFEELLKKYGQIGVNALLEATPKDTGLTSRSWSYSIEYKKKSVSLLFTNSNIQDGVNVAFVIQYGHATQRGAYIAGRDYINPAMRSVFDMMIKELKSNGVL